MSLRRYFDNVIENPMFQMGAGILAAPNIGQGIQQGVQHAHRYQKSRDAREQQAQLMEQQQQQQALQNERLRASDARAADLHPLKLKQMRAAIANQHAQIAAHNRRFRPQPVQAAKPDPMANIGMKPDGSIYTLEQGQTDLRGQSARDTMNPNGRVGMFAQDIPGVVTSEKSGKSDKFATGQLAGQEALNQSPSGDRQRFLEYKALQDRWSYLHGKKARAGHMYDYRGREVPIGPPSKARDEQSRKDRAISNMIKQIKASEAQLLKSSGLSRAVAGGLKDMGTAGRFANNILGLEGTSSALDQYREGILQTVYALSGKQTTNREMEAFLDLYLPKAGESEPLIKNKTRRLMRMLNTLQNGVAKGMVYEEAQARALSSVGGSESQIQKRSLKSKYGLE